MRAGRYNNTVVALALATLATAQQPAKPARAAATTGRWIVKKSVSKMDDSQTVVLSLPANSTVSGWPQKVVTPVLVLRCKEGEIDAFVNVILRPNVEYGNTEGATVQVRFDKTPARQMSVTQSTDGEAVFFADAKGTIVRMLEHRSMLFRFTPFNSDPQETTFTLSGLAAVVKPLQDACEWDMENERREAEAARQKQEGLDVEIITELTERLLDRAGSDDRRAIAAYDLGQQTGSRYLRIAVPALIKALEDPYFSVRFNVAKTLGIIGRDAAEALPALEAMLRSEKDARVLEQVKGALRKLKP